MKMIVEYIFMSRHGFGVLEKQELRKANMCHPVNV